MLLLLLASLTALADEPRARTSDIGWKLDTGVGVALGQGIGPTVKHYLDRRGRHAVDAGLLLHATPSASLHAGWSVHPSTLVSSHTLEVPWRVGVGAFAGYNGGIDRPGWFRPPYPDSRQGYAGLRGVVGADLDLVDMPLQIHLDLTPYLTVVPQPWLSFSAVIGARWYL